MAYATEAERLRARAESRRREREKRRADRELANYLNRVRYWRDPERAREQTRERNRRRRADPETKFRASERLSRRKAAALRRASKRALHWLAAAASRSLAEMQNPSYLVIDRHGQPRRELWPLHDEAARWLAAHALPDVDTQDTQVST